MIAPMTKTIPMMLNTELPVLVVLLMADQIAGCDVSWFGMFTIVTKNAKTPTARIISEITIVIIISGSMNLNFTLLPPFISNF